MQSDYAYHCRLHCTTAILGANISPEKKSFQVKEMSGDQAMQENKRNEPFFICLDFHVEFILFLIFKSIYSVCFFFVNFFFSI